MLGCLHTQKMLMCVVLLAWNVFGDGSDVYAGVGTKLLTWDDFIHTHGAAPVPAWNYTPDSMEVRELLALISVVAWLVVGLPRDRASDAVSRARKVVECRLRISGVHRGTCHHG